MKRRFPTGTEDRGRAGLFGVAAACALLAVIFAACGISFSAEPEETELFKRLSVESDSGDFAPGEPLTLLLEYEQPYTVRIEVRCDVLEVDPPPTPDYTPTPIIVLGILITPVPTAVSIPRIRPTPSNKVIDVLIDAIPPNPDGGIAGEATPVPGTIEERFVGPEQPGRYIAKCFTPLDVNNAIVEEFTIS
ncbi:MAG: hypothetical protein IH866_00065 [Chloroflexi bacterium]|nr:hypothetical protein [Chloroflexota bacterium]